MNFRRLEEKKIPQINQNGRTAESRYWRKFKFPILVKEFAAVTSIDFCKTEPHDFAVTSSTRVQIYSAHTNSIKKTISRFKDVAYSANFRDDGKLLLAGGENGIVQLFDLTSRTTLRTFKGHAGPVHITRFGLNKTNILTASDDTTVRCWDIPSESEVIRFRDHEDYVRAGVVSQDNNDIWVTGSYDHKIKIWDVRTGKSGMTMDHGSPVESLLLFPGSGVVVSAGSNEIKIWDVLAGGRLMRTLSNHQKTITSLCFDSSHTRILTASLDHHVKIYNVEDYKVVHSVKYPAPLLCVGISPDDTHLVAGMANGLLSIRRRIVTAEEEEQISKVTKIPRGGTYAYYIRGRKHHPTQEDFTVQKMRKPKLQIYDIFLKKFQYKNAFDSAFKKKGCSAIEIVSLIEELIHRDGLRIALRGRNERTLIPILRFLDRNMLIPKYSLTLLSVFELILDMYASVIGQSMKIDKIFLKIKNKIKHEVTFQKNMYSLLGAMDMLFASSNF